jgi:hypothetical protein
MLTLRRDGEVVGTSTRPWMGSWEVPAGAARYALELEAARSAPQLTLSTKVRTVWGFGSASAGGAAVRLPLLTVAAHLPVLDVRNQAPAGRPTPVELTIGRQPGSPASEVDQVRVWVSADDGGRWAPVAVRRTGDRWVANLPGGKAGEHVSLRVSAVDREGSTVDQTMTRAYRLR